MDLEKLLSFYQKAALNTYIGGGEYEKTPEREGFFELTFNEGDWSYRDSYAGDALSFGTETIKYQNKFVWCSQYYGGMAPGKESLSERTFNFLKTSMRQKPTEFSARGPSQYTEEDWEYNYVQDGNIESYRGLEIIKYKGEIVFEYKINGGLIT